MSKKKWFQTAIFILIPILTIGIYLYFFQPRYLFHASQEKDITVSDSQTIVLKADDPDERPGSLEIEITGELNGIMDIVLEDSHGPVQFISLKGPKVDHSWNVPWDQTSCKLRFKGREGADGKFHLSYRFMDGE